jgi:4-hydroxy-tetrahydrodipicolinate reductase
MGFDIEVIEAHHREKKDAPSGTALRLVDVAAAAPAPCR